MLLGGAIMKRQIKNGTYFTGKNWMEKEEREWDRKGVTEGDKSGISWSSCQTQGASHSVLYHSNVSGEEGRGEELLCSQWKN